MKSLCTLILIVNLNAFAGVDATDDHSHSVDKEEFTIQDTSQLAHMFAGVAITMTGQLILTKVGMRPIPATLTAMAFTALLGATKEVFIDGYCSRSGIKSFWVGAAIGGSVTVLTW